MCMFISHLCGMQDVFMDALQTKHDDAGLVIVLL